jgi:ABC-2 type transport system ATP-binding protein
VIEAEGLVKVYDGVPAVQGLTFRVAPGEIVGLVGPNGAGKTTTLRSLTGIVVPTRGTVRIAGHDLAREPVAAKARLAFVPDEPQLFPYLTVREHFDFTARLYGVPDSRGRIASLAEELELSAKLDALPGELSRGMRQKLAMGCGLLHQPDALLLDEPLTGLDPSGMRRMKATILRRAEAGAAVLLSSHLLHVVQEVCGRVLVMQDGRLVALGTIAEIVERRPDLAGQSLEGIYMGLVSREVDPGVSPR